MAPERVRSDGNRLGRVPFHGGVTAESMCASTAFLFFSRRNHTSTRGAVLDTSARIPRADLAAPQTGFELRAFIMREHQRHMARQRTKY